jgi:Uma2 family endonuclease
MTITATQPTEPPAAEKLPPLENGDCLDQPTFHARYLAMPEDVKAELIGGIVFMASPVSRRHGRTHPGTLHWLVEYQAATPGVEVLGDATIILDGEGEVQPDACIRILPQFGGRTSDAGEYVRGAPELVIEVASSSESSDLHRKKLAYERAGSDEYVIVLLRQRDVRWFILRDGVYQLLAPDADGIYRSRRFPGLWLDPQALLAGDVRRVREVLEQGLATTEHAAFVAALQAAGSSK